MSIKVFRSDLQTESESDYRNWLGDNPDGYVVNAFKRTRGKGNKSDERFTRIHRASCKTINPLKRKIDKTGFTTGDYQKICSTNFLNVENEAKKMTGLTSIIKCRCI
ncbi:hypothetical protein VY428_004537 [Escherichia coli]|uniref:hypothetical protein n=1 Tax=Shigella boydii TaxID=621 RepID=UPI000BB08291|nr:hypothetical protein [Shigella boydii]ELQ7783259.1 hypothetical protein [Escherichia coli]EME5697982.1 hypothetical protein [Escherichia coli]PAY85729.1 hypothetical protein CEG94_16640 [Shigella boydii]HDX3053561.1 hypothetical protein [Escherichia coli]